MTMIKVEIVIAVHNRRDITLNCLSGLNAIDRTGLDVHVIVVDDASTDGTVAAIGEQFPDVQIINGDGDLWYTGATNRGIEAALERSPDYILGLNDDSEFDPQFLRHMVALAAARKKTVVGALLVRSDDRKSVFQVAPKFRIGWGGVRHWYRQTIDTVPDDPWRVELIVGNCVLFPTAAIKEVGLMLEKQLPQYGDAEYTPRMRRRGWELLIEPRAKVYCKPNYARESALSMGPRRFYRNVIRSSSSPQSLKRRFFMNLGAAPNKLSGFLAFLVFFFRFAIGRNMEGEWGQRRPEPKFTDLYADATTDRN